MLHCTPTEYVSLVPASVTPERAVELLDAIPSGADAEQHRYAEQVMLAALPPEVRDAAIRVMDRIDWWYE